jgi:hypothetical protein
MKDKKQIIIFAVLLAVCIVILAVVVIKPIRNKVANNKTENEENIETSEAPQTEVEVEKPTEVVVSEGGQVDEMLYEALDIIMEDKSEEYATAIANLTELSDNGNVDAQYILGELYFQGIGTDADIDRAAEYIKLAYDNGNANAFEIYGKLAFIGDGISQDYEEAYSAFRLIDEPSADINCAIGMMYAYGMGVRIDYDIAASYLDEAIAKGSTTAQTVKDAISGLKRTARSSEAATIVPAKVISRTDYTASDVEGLDELVKGVSQKLGESETYTAFGDELVAMSKVNPALVSSIAIFGKDNWLFFQSEEDGDSYHDYIGDNEFSDTELEAIKNNLLKQEKKANDAGAQFVLVIYPNKEIIYSDKMPSYIKRETEITRTDKLVEYLRENTDLEIIYPKDEYLALKDEYQLYYATDTHCNMVGTFISLKELLNNIYEKDVSLNIDKFAIHSTEYSGDIGVMIGRDDRYSFDTVYFLGEKGAALEDKVDASMSLIGDSFSEFLNIEAGYYFNNGVNHYMVNDYSYDYNTAMDAALSKGGSDIIVWECAERCVDRLE